MAVLNYAGGTNDGAAVAYKGSDFGVVNFGFPLETVSDVAVREQLLCNAIEFLIDDTHKFHMISSIGFMNVLNQTIWDKFVMEYGGIVDGTDVQSESLRAPFNMSAFTFCKGTYMDVGVGKNNGEKIKGQDASNSQNGSQNKTSSPVNNANKSKNTMKKNRSKISSLYNRLRSWKTKKNYII